jgi:hypothetical protein
MSKSETAEPGQSLIDWSGHWELDGDYVRCQTCNSSQQVSYMHYDFSHASWCSEPTLERNPWKSLMGLISAEMMRAKAP